jgi:hypothetical protein
MDFRQLAKVAANENVPQDLPLLKITQITYGGASPAPQFHNLLAVF